MGFSKKEQAEIIECTAQKKEKNAEYLNRKDVKERSEFQLLNAAAGLEDFIVEEGDFENE